MLLPWTRQGVPYSVDPVFSVLIVNFIRVQAVRSPIERRAAGRAAMRL
jgi:hypothetical protein